MPAVLSTTSQRRRLMSRIKGKNTAPEIALRRAAWSHGLRYRLHYRIGHTRPDMVFIASRLAVFVDGCFWHGCPRHSTIPKNNGDFWKQKLDRNRERDAEQAAWLEACGWRVLRFWEHEIEASPAECANRIAVLLGNVRGAD
ncbi:very short patch repair endonuclease [Luteimonas viscosa]|uniref:Very short patch repair endonuclease n=1 Tax=Luteimonas viscosa TaxID=1132694 RepID=A0A5D4XT66_9GAMM|nr:very short patch repair endonuclease [Luteimonas viscosa]